MNEYFKNTDHVNDDFVLKIIDFIEDMTKEIETMGEYKLLQELSNTLIDSIGIEKY